MKRYHDSLIKALKDPKEAAEYLNAALEEGDKEMFLVALRNVAEAHGGMVQLSRFAKLNRPNLYRIFSKKGNPEIQTLARILGVFGLRLTVSPKAKRTLRVA
ncbi:MAG: addiction module antidote protein [Candidatus Omnitrophota bacterium]